jgi:hypothetical protein
MARWSWQRWTVAAVLGLALTGVAGCASHQVTDTTVSDSATTSVASQAPSQSATTAVATTTASTASTSSSEVTPSTPTGTPMALPESFGGWTLVESHAAKEWTVGAYTKLATGDAVQVQATTALTGTFEGAIAELLGSQTEQVSTGAVCATRAGFSGCLQQQDGVTVLVTSSAMTEMQTADVLAQFLATIR